MKRSLCLWLVLAGLITTAIGCSGPPPAVPAEKLARGKVDAFNELADAMAKDANGVEARQALEHIRNHTLDVRQNRKDAEEIMEIYNQRIKGKYQGEVAQEAAMEIAPIEGVLNQVKSK